MNVFDRLLSLNLTWRDAVDIIVVAVIIYYILVLIRGTRAMQITIGLMIIAAIVFVARILDLPALEAISARLLFYLPFAIIVVFQQEIRRALAMMAANPLAALFQTRPGLIPFDAILDACEILSAKRLGALIVIEGTHSLRLFEEGGKPVDAWVTAEMLVSIFTTGGPLHDGAVIVRGNRIAAANAFLPLTTTPDPTLAHGTRHRAAIGLSEESDALVIVISEENGSMAVASEGALQEHLDRSGLLHALTGRFGEAP